MNPFFAVMVNAGLALAFGWLGWQAVRRTPEKAASILLLLSLVLLLVASKGLKDRLFWVAWFPIPNVGIFCNPVSPAAAFLAGIVGQRLGKTSGRRLGIAWVLGAAGFAAAFASAFGGVPPLSDKPQWQDGVLQQTSAATCGAASAATLLRSIGIASSESEMAQICHTTQNGTAMLDLYQGLAQKTKFTGYKPVAVTTTDVSELRHIVTDGPLLISVLFVPVKAARATLFHSALGTRHAVVFFGFRPDNTVEIGDPMEGRTVWTMDEFRRRWAGEGIQLRHTAY